MDSQDNDYLTSEVTYSSLSEKIKQASEPILRQVEEIHALLVSQNESEAAGNGRTTFSR